MSDFRAVAHAHIPAAVVGSAAVVAIVGIYLSGRGLVFFFDEWDFILGRRVGFGRAFLEPHNGHLSAVPVAVYRVLFATVGLEHYGVYRLAVAALHGLCGVLVYLYARGRTEPALAAVAALSLLSLTGAWQDLLWPFQIGFLASMACGLLALRLRDQGRPTASALALVGALASSGLGVLLVAASVAEALLRRDRRGLLSLGLPIGSYSVWYLAFGESQARASNLRYVPAHVWGSISEASHALAGVPKGPLAAAAFAVLVCAGAIAFVRSPDLRPRLLFAAVGAGGFWASTALSRGHFAEPDASRYVYPSGVFLLVGLLELGRTVRGRRVASTAAVATLVVLSGFAGSLHEFRAGVRFLRDSSSHVAAGLGAIELAPWVDGKFRPDPLRAPQIETGPYRAAVRELGSPALTAAQIEKAAPAVRTTADAVILRSGPARLEVAGGPGSGVCRFAPGGEVGAVAGGATLSNTSAQSVEVWIRSFGDADTPTRIGEVLAGATARLHLPAPAPGRRWLLVVSGPVKLCD